jgi:hypothetical protein
MFEHESNVMLCIAEHRKFPFSHGNSVVFFVAALKQIQFSSGGNFGE